MLGPDKKKKKPQEKWEFDLEKDLKAPANLRSMKEKVNARIQELKTVLRQGEDKKNFEDAQVLLHGYVAAQKVIQRAGR